MIIVKKKAKREAEVPNTIHSKLDLFFLDLRLEVPTHDFKLKPILRIRFSRITGVHRKLLEPLNTTIGANRHALLSASPINHLPPPENSANDLAAVPARHPYSSGSSCDIYLNARILDSVSAFLTQDAQSRIRVWMVYVSPVLLQLSFFSETSSIHRSP